MLKYCYGVHRDMPITVGGKSYYRTAEVCRAVGISRATFFRWLKESIVREAEHRDRKGWRLFTEEEVARFKAEATRIHKV